MAAARRRPPRRRVRRGWVVVLVLVVAIAALGGGVVAVVHWLDRAFAAPFVAACTATDEGSSYQLSPAQADNAAVISAVAVRRGLPARAATIALATALQESGLINLNHGDLDSLGLFQQRPSQGWGTAEQVTDPVFATNTFYDRLVKVPHYTDLPITKAAQAVQRSAFPDAYAAHEPRARAFASALTGWSQATLTCALPAAATAGSPDAVLARVARDLGDLPSSSTAPDEAAKTKATVTLDATTLAPDDAARGGWAVAQWAVAVANALQLDQVTVADQVWTRGARGWHPAATALPAGQVLLTLAS
ncbi:MAG TPA: hypothetical protein VGC04_02415 [Cellulomonas sp.]